MKKIVVVDDEEATRSSLALGLRAGLAGYTVLAIDGGREALALLAHETVDLVVTDLRMPERDERELIALLRQEHPGLPVVVVSGRSNVDSVDSFTKPINLNALCRRVEAILAETVKGRVENMNLASFLQLLELEHKTCALQVESAGRSAELFFLGGRLVDASAGELRGEEAAFEIVTWESADIEISNLEPEHPIAIRASLSFLLMEAMRRKDEAAAAGTAAASANGLTSSLARLAALDGTVAALIALERSGEILGIAPGLSEVAAKSMAREGATLLKRERRSARSPNANDAPEEILVTSSQRFAIVRPLDRAEEGAFLLVVLDAARANLALARIQILAIAEEISY
jgi:CheY-like chemotaxis protein